MGQFDHYPDMNQDGKKDIYDCVTYIELMEEDESEDCNTEYSTPAIRPRDLTPEQREQMRMDQQVEETVKWVMTAIFALIAWVCFKNPNGFTVLVGLFSAVAAVRMLFL